MRCRVRLLAYCSWAGPNEPGRGFEARTDQIRKGQGKGRSVGSPGRAVGLDSSATKRVNAGQSQFENSHQHAKLTPKRTASFAVLHTHTANRMSVILCAATAFTYVGTVEGEQMGKGKENLL